MGIPLLHPWANRRTDTVLGCRNEVDLDDAMTLTQDTMGCRCGLLAAAVGWRVNRHEATEDGGALAASFDFAAAELMAAFPFPHEVLFRGEPAGTT